MGSANRHTLRSGYDEIAHRWIVAFREQDAGRVRSFSKPCMRMRPGRRRLHILWVLLIAACEGRMAEMRLTQESRLQLALPRLKVGHNYSCFFISLEFLFLNLVKSQI